MLMWSEAHAISLHFITLGRPTENIYAESFIGKFWHEYLRQHWFRSLAEAKTVI